MLWKEHKPRFALQGVIDGDALPWLAEVQEKAKLGEAIAIDCMRLVRMDFAAAGSVLNWSAQMQELGHVLQFSQLHQLLAVFFNVVGIQEHAQVLQGGISRLEPPCSAPCLRALQFLLLTLLRLPQAAPICGGWNSFTAPPF